MKQGQLTGKIFWIEFDFKLNGVYIPKDGNTSFYATKIANAIVSEEMIKFFTEPYELDGDLISYRVNMIRKAIGFRYEGEFSLETDSDWKGYSSCELFQNSEAFFLYGTWNEDGIDYTWYARIMKEETKTE